MNILLLTSVYPSIEQKNENITKVVQYFTQEWVRQGHNVKVIHNIHRYPAIIHNIPKGFKQKIASKISFYIPDLSVVSECTYKDGKIDVWRCPIKKIKPHGGHSKLEIKKQSDKIIGILDGINYKPDIIMGHWMSPQIQIIAELKKKFNCRTSLVLHGRGYINDGKFDCTPYIKYIDALGCRSKTDSEFVCRELALKKKPFICYSGIPDSFINKTKFQNKFAKEKKVWRFIYVGRLIEYKQIDKTLLALSKIKDKEYVFDIIGVGCEEQKLRELSMSYGIGEKVVFHGQMSRKRVLEYMNLSDCFIMISKGEAFGLVYLEAMASSCITIGSLQEGIDGVIKNGENGFLCEAANANSLERQLKIIMSLQNQELQVIARKGYDTACKFTDSNVAKWYINNAMHY